MNSALSADDIIALLDLSPHPEGGFFRETFRDKRSDGNRAASTAIYFLLPKGVRSHWHRVDAAEVWHFYAGAPLTLFLSEYGQTETQLSIGPDLTVGQRPQGIVPSGAWQAAESQGDWTLVGCTVAPGFEFAHFEMAPEGWTPVKTSAPTRGQ